MGSTDTDTKPMSDGEIVVALHEIAERLDRVCQTIERDARQVQR
jgi:hypothetical protein